ncbi:MAG TPA: Ku protein [Clostridia bacterium]|nr:Ku protein [Clostridia bacterium]
MHTMWKGSISFGLVNIPVKMFAATEDKDIKFRYIHKTCSTPVKYEKVCPACDKEIQPDEIATGYEYEPGSFVVMKDEDFDSIKPEMTKSIEITDFVLLKEIDPIYYHKTYYLSPQDTGGKAYNLLREAMNQTNKIAVARIILRDKQSLAVVRVYKNILVLETIFYPDEVRSSAQIPGIPETANVNEAELKIANQLIDNLTVAFNPEKYKDDYREKLIEVINKKVAGKEVVKKPDVQKQNIIDLMQALQASVKQVEKERNEKKKSDKKTLVKQGS